MDDEGERRGKSVLGRLGTRETKGGNCSELDFEVAARQLKYMRAELLALLRLYDKEDELEKERKKGDIEKRHMALWPPS